MKQRLVLIVVAFLSCASMKVRAQLEPGTFSIQPKLGLMASTVTDMTGYSSGTGLTYKRGIFPGLMLGVEAEYQLSKRLSIATGFNFTSQGCKWKDIQQPGFDIKDNHGILNYINMPIVANVYLFKGFAIKTGVQLSFLTSAYLRLKIVEKFADGTQETTKIDEDMRNELHKFDIAIPVGLSYELKGKWVFDLRYHFGLIRVNEDTGDYNDKSMNRTLLLTCGYKLGLW